jgi:hypothetical protein
MAAGASAAGAAAAVANAIKASGVLVRVAPEEFLKILNRAKDPLVVVARGGWLGDNFRYLTSYKGLAFYSGSPQALSLPTGCEVVTAKSIQIPG